MKYLFLIFLLCSCKTQIKLENSYNHKIDNGSFVEYEKQELKNIVYLEFKNRMVELDLNNLMITVHNFRKNHKEIATSQIISNITLEEELNKEDIIKLANIIGAKYVISYKFHNTNQVDDLNNRVYISHSNGSIFYLSYFFVDKDE